MTENHLIGVHLIGCSIETKTCLGVALVPKKTDILLHDFRDMLKCQIHTLPENFNFCTKQGWPINKNLESSAFLSQVLSEENSLCIQRHYEHPCVGITQKSGEKLGMIFVDLQTKLKDVRHTIQTQMTGNKLTNHNYWFVNNHDWPISCKQENKLTVIDILDNSCIKIDIQTFITPTCSPGTPSPLPRKKIKGSRHLSFRTSKDLDRKQIADSSVADEKQILISYARADAGHHALALKQELSSLGYSVYLDVHEITSGVDWQDSLNSAVRNCQVFIPLVTPKYGETLWTNREIKLADLLGKYIIPISFLTDWPPPCLAIQFSSTQYVSWRDPLSLDETKDIFTWSLTDLRYVTKQIAEKVNTFLNTDRDLPSLIKRKTVVKSCPCVHVSNPQASIENREGFPLVVICIHPQQSRRGEEMKDWFEANNFEVWCTTQLSMDYPDSVTDQNIGIKPGSTEIKNRQIFQEKADEAGVIVLILSKQFVESRTCQQQVFYCEQRKKLVPLMHDDFVVPRWLSVLTGFCMLMNVSKYKELLLPRVHQLLGSALYNKETLSDNFITDLTTAVSNRLSVYILGSCLLDDYTEKVCRSLGVWLATIDSLVVGTGGHNGTEEIIGENFYKESQRLWKTNNKLLHIMSEKQFENKQYGQSLLVGSSNEEKDDAVAKVFDICVLIGGSAEVTNLSESFTWLEKTVIPVFCTGEDLSQLSQKPGETSDWLKLQDSTTEANQIGEAVKNIVLQNALNYTCRTTEPHNMSSPNSNLRKMTTMLLPEKS